MFNAKYFHKFIYASINESIILVPKSITRTSYLYEFLQLLLNEPSELYFHVIRWQNQFEGIFKIVNPAKLAQLWGKTRNLPGMTYDNLSRSLRNYYKTNKMKKVTGQRQVYQFIFSEKNPPQMPPQVGHFTEQRHQLEKDTLFHQGLGLSVQSPQKCPKTPQKSKKTKQVVKSDINAIQIDETIKTEMLPSEPCIEFKEEIQD